MNWGEIVSGTSGIIIFLISVAITVLWIIFPFAVFGIKDKLDKIIKLNEEIVKLLKRPTPESSDNEELFKR